MGFCLCAGVVILKLYNNLRCDLGFVGITGELMSRYPSHVGNIHLICTV